MASLADMLRNFSDSVVNLPTEAQRFMVSPTSFIDALRGKTTLPAQAGFAQGATGTPQKENLTVLDPNNRAYMEGYSQGEPFSYAAMGVPALEMGATKLSNKAVQAITGNPKATASGVIDYASAYSPTNITAWHGSPHTFEKFDMSKVGTGEGAQAYGHGMYFAEVPTVAEGYKNSITFKNDPLTYNGKTTPEIDKAIKELGYFYKNAENVNLTNKNELNQFITNSANLLESEGAKDLAQTIKKLDLSKISENKGNLYKVDIPDEHIPTMMDWDKPLGQQSAFVKKAINNLKKQVTPEMKMELGDDLNLLFGKDITPNQFLNTWEIIHPTGGTGIGEKLLNEQGVKGIRYLDNTSRDAGKGTSNFVVFDPTDVKILERNNQPLTRKEILEEGFSKAENPLVDIFHGTDPKSAKAIEKSGFDVTKSADGTIWFTSNPNIGEVAATGKGGIVKRKLDQSKMKLGGWEEADKYSTNELMQKGYDGLMLKDSDGITYQIFNPEKLLK